MKTVTDSVAAYEAWAPESGRLIEDARRYFPGGDTRMSAHFSPYPLFIESASGCRMVDADGHEIVDFMNNFTSLLFGHANPAIVEAVTQQVAAGSAYAAPTRSQVELARLLTERVPSLEQLRFTSSGTEATLMTLRCARAVTGRQRIMKMEGGYHGSYELAEVSLAPLPDACGPLEKPESVAIDASIPDSALNDAVICPYNEPELARGLIAAHADDLAAVIVEPILGSMGMIPATTEFLTALRDACTTHGVILIFDEVITLRVADGGAQSVHGVLPDLTAMGKIIGGGLPVGAFGGRADLMRVFHPDERRPVMHASTFSGNPLTMAAGAAAMGQVNPQLIEQMNGLGARFRDAANGCFSRHGIRGQATGSGSLSNLHLTDGPLNDARASLAGSMRAGGATQTLHLGMLRRGVAGASRLMYCISAPMTVADVDFAVAALDDCLDELKPGFTRDFPDLVT